MSVIREEELPESHDSNAWQAHQIFTALMSLAQKAYDEGYNALVKIKAYSGLPSSKGEDIYEFFVSGIPTVVSTGGGVSSVPTPKASKKLQSLAEGTRNKAGLPEKTSQKQSRKQGSYIDDVRIIRQ